MKTIVSFFKNYFQEVYSCILTLGIAAAIATASFHGLSTMSTAMLLLIFFAIFVLNTVVCAKRCQKAGNFTKMRICVFICAVLIYSVFIYRCSYDEVQVSCVVTIAILTCLISDGVITAHWRKILAKEDPDAYTRLLIRDGYTLSEQQQMRLLAPNMENELYCYIRDHYLCKEGERLLFVKPIPDYIRLTYIQRYNLYPEAQSAIFYFSDPHKWLESYIEYGGKLSEESINRVFKLPEASKLIGMIVKNGTILSDNHELRLFELPNGKELYLLYRQKYIPCNKAEQKAITLGWI